MTGTRIFPRPDGKVDIGSSLDLPDGQVRRQAVTLDAENLSTLADRLDDFVAGRARPEVDHVMGKDVIAFVYGGADYSPTISIINLGPNRGTLWISADQAPELTAMIRGVVAAPR